jgi:hypothetical protein
VKDSFFIFPKQMAQFGFGEAMVSLGEVAEVSRSAVGLFLEEDGPFCRGDTGLDPGPVMCVTGHVRGFMTFTVIQQFITHRNICYNKQLYNIRVSIQQLNLRSPKRSLLAITLP